MLAIDSLASKFRAVAVHGPVLRAVAWLVVTGAVLLVVRQFWPRYALSCIRHPSEARPGGVLEDVDCSFQRVSTIAPDGSLAMQSESYFLELKNVTVHMDGTRWTIALNEGTAGKRVNLAAFATENEAQAAAKPLDAFLASCQDPKHRDATLTFSISSDSSWTAGGAGIAALIAALGMILGLKPGHEVLELSASTGTATLTQSSLAGAFVASRSFPLERVVRVGIAPAASILPPRFGSRESLVPAPRGPAAEAASPLSAGVAGSPAAAAAGRSPAAGDAGRVESAVRLYLEVMDAVTGEGALLWFGPAALQDDADVSMSPCRALSCGSQGCSAGPGGWGAGGVTLADAAAAANHWLRSYVETGVGAAAEEHASSSRAGQTAAEGTTIRLRRGSASRLLAPGTAGGAAGGDAGAAREGEDGGCADPSSGCARNQLRGQSRVGDAAAGASEAPCCVVCRERPPTTALVPCRHLCLCQPCSHSVHNQRLRKCPVCRAAIEGVFRVVLVT